MPCDFLGAQGPMAGLTWTFPGTKKRGSNWVGQQEKDSRPRTWTHPDDEDLESLKKRGASDPGL